MDPFTRASLAARSNASRRDKSRMVATTRNPAFASSTEVSNPKPLEQPVIRAIFSGMAKVYHSREKTAAAMAKKWENRIDRLLRYAQRVHRGGSHADYQASPDAQSIFSVPSAAHGIFAANGLDPVWHARLGPGCAGEVAVPQAAKRGEPYSASHLPMRQCVKRCKSLVTTALNFLNRAHRNLQLDITPKSP